MTIIDPTARWSAYGYKPDYAGLLSFAGAPYTEDVEELAGVDVAIVGAPMDDLVSDRPGARLGPRAIRASSCPPGPHLEAGVNAFEQLRVVDFGDAPVIPADPLRSHQAIRDTVALVVSAGGIPVILGGDHSIAEPDMLACFGAHGPLGLVHFDAHTDTGNDFGLEVSHGRPMYRLVEAGAVDPGRYVQVGLRGYWPGEEEFAWQQERGITSLFMHDIRDRGIRAIVAEALAVLGEQGPVFMSVDVDVLDPAYAPGTGTPESGGMTAVDLLWACRTIAAGVDLVGADVVEVAPDRIGSRDITAHVAERIVREVLTGLAVRRRAN
jgi:agmatinase